MKSAFWGLAASLVALSFVNPATRMSPVDLLAALEAGIRATPSRSPSPAPARG